MTQTGALPALTIVQQWCHWQVKAHEDTSVTWTCAAHLCEGRAFECPYRDMEHAKQDPYPCVDAEPVRVGDLQ